LKYTFVRSSSVQKMRVNPNIKGLFQSLDVIDRIKNGKAPSLDDMMSPLDGSFVFSLNNNSKIRLVHSRQDVVVTVRSALNDGWVHVRGKDEICTKVRLVSDSDYGGSRQFSLGGNPWKQSSSAFSKEKKSETILDSIDSRRALLRCLAKLFSQGWIVEVSTNFSPKNDALSNIVFGVDFSQDVSKSIDQEIRFDLNENVWKRCDFACISFHGPDKIRLCHDSVHTEAAAILVTGNSQCRGDVCAHPDEIVASIAIAIRDAWPMGLAEWSMVGQGTAFEFRLVGAPWKSSGADTVDVRQFTCLMLENLCGCGWMPVTTLCCTTTSNGFENLIVKRRRKNCTEKGIRSSSLPTEGWVLAEKPPKDPICCISLHEPNILRVIGFQDHDDVQVVVDTLSHMWPLAGVGDVFQHKDSVQVNLVGEPWSDNQRSIGSGYMIMARIMQTLAESCNLSLVNNCGALTLSKNKSSKSSFFFTKRKYEGDCPDGSYPVVVLSLHESGTIRLSNLTDSEDVLIPSLKKALELSWPDGVEELIKDVKHPVYTYNLNCCPWYSRGKRELHLKSMLGHVLAAVRCSGWKVIASADIFGDRDGSCPRTTSSGANAWFLTKDTELFEAPDVASESGVKDKENEQEQDNDQEQERNPDASVICGEAELSSRLSYTSSCISEDSFYSSDDSASVP